MNRHTSIAAGIAISAAAFTVLLGAEPFGGTTPPLAAPGAIVTSDSHEICAIIGGLSYSKRHRATPLELKHEIFMRDLGYIPRGAERRQWEIDHRVPLCLGGADVAENLWAQQGFKAKDEDEAFACHEVCRGSLPIKAAQACFLADLRDLSHCLGRK